MGILEKMQDDLADALISHNQTLRHGHILNAGYIQESQGRQADATKAAEEARRRSRRDVDSAAKQIAELKNTISEFAGIVKSQQDTIEALQAALAQKDELLEEWVVSQTVFMNLFREHARREDGTRIADLPTETRQAILDKAFSAVKAQRAEKSNKPTFMAVENRMPSRKPSF